MRKILYITITLFFAIISTYLGICFTINNLKIDGIDDGKVIIEFMGEYLEYEYEMIGG